MSWTIAVRGGIAVTGSIARAGPYTFTLHDLPVPDYDTVIAIMCSRYQADGYPVTDYIPERGWLMSHITLTEAEAMTIANGADPVALLTGPRIRLEIVRTGSCQA